MNAGRLLRSFVDQHMKVWVNETRHTSCELLLGCRGKRFEVLERLFSCSPEFCILSFGFRGEIAQFKRK